MAAIIHSPVTELLEREGIAFDVIEIPLTEDKKPGQKPGRTALKPRH